MGLGADMGKEAVDELTDKTLPEIDEDAKAIIDYFFSKIDDLTSKIDDLTITTPLGVITVNLKK